ncbi:BA75_01283T0 [Komagataella pastoris]|uniref:BA75_01283T0 n=1 Tax=Komagataella pastoris TaxID=4922 RepID=A0A1B2J612_PICPA|nr:BA75_01283T0 [Komagataella pastoris]
MSSESRTYSFKVFSILTYALSIYGEVRYFLFRTHHSRSYLTPFTGNSTLDYIYVIATLLLQLLFVVQYFSQDTTVSAREQKNVLEQVGYHFSIYNVLNFIWVYLFKHKRFLFAEIVLFVNLFNLLSLYFIHKTYAIKDLGRWFTIHLSTAALPLSWIQYAIFWNGAALFHSHYVSLLPRLLANLLIWEFLLVPAFFIVVFGDYGVGFSSSYLTLSIAVGQLLTKVIGLQWIFGFVIAGTIFLLSLLVSTGVLAGKVANNNNVLGSDREQAPLLT